VETVEDETFKGFFVNGVRHGSHTLVDANGKESQVLYKYGRRLHIEDARTVFDWHTPDAPLLQ